MAPKSRVVAGGAPESLAKFEPTEEELAAARAILSQCDKSKAHSRMQSMANWLKRNEEGEGNKKIMASRGNDRMEYLSKYMAWQMRRGTNSLTSTTTATEGKRHEATTKAKTEFQLRKEFGDAMFEYWKSSGLLRKHPNRVTGSMEDDVCEWLVTDEEFVKSKGWQQGSEVKSTGDCKLEDQANIGALGLEFEEGLFTGSASDDKSTDSKNEKNDATEQLAPIKQEKEEAPTADSAVKEFLAQPCTKMTEMQKHATNMKVIVSQCAGVEFIEPFQAECELATSKLDRTNKILSKICMGQQVSLSRMPKLMASMEAQVAQVEKLQKLGAQRYGIALPTATKRRRKAKA